MKSDLIIFPPLSQKPSRFSPRQSNYIIADPSNLAQRSISLGSHYKWFRRWATIAKANVNSISVASIPQQVDPCLPSICGPYSICKVIGESPSCTCQPNYIGAPPNCRPECVSNSECPSNLACVNQKCRDPCPGSCGYNADCKVISHALVCACPFGQTGDPLVSCNPIQGSYLSAVLINMFP